MLILQGVGLLLYLVAALILAAAFFRGNFVRRLLFGKLPSDKFADVVHQVMAKVQTPLRQHFGCCCCGCCHKQSCLSASC